MLCKYLVAVFAKIIPLIWIIIFGQKAVFLDLEFVHTVHFMRCNLGPVDDQSLGEKLFQIIVVDISFDDKVLCGFGHHLSIK